MLTRVMIRWLPWAVKLGYHTLPLKAFTESNKAVIEELGRIQLFISQGGRQFRIVYSDTHCFKGAGDFVLALALGRFLEQLGWACELVRVDISKDSNSYTKSQLAAVYGPESVMDANAATQTVFESRVASRLDISGPMLSLLSRIQLSSDLNPERIRPELQPKPSKLRKSMGFGSAFIAMHVRSSHHSVDRNPSSDLVIRDVCDLAQIFPSAEIRWFGDKWRFEQVRSQLTPELQGRLSFQRGDSFVSASLELGQAAFWYQRSGGGIGVFPLFNLGPYLILSTDVPATRLYDRVRFSLVPWASGYQQYRIQVFRSRTRLKSVLKSRKWGAEVRRINEHLRIQDANC